MISMHIAQDYSIYYCNTVLFIYIHWIEIAASSPLLLFSSSSLLFFTSLSESKRLVVRSSGFQSSFSMDGICP